MKGLIGCLRDERRAEALMTCFILGALVYVIQFAIANNYLPQPFFYEPSDTFADWFNTAFWARNGGTYDTWATLYPPLSFVFLRLVGLDHCYPATRAWDPSAGLAARDCDWLGLAAIYGFFLFNLVLIYLTFRKIDRRTALFRTICLGLGWPMLNGLERGNLVLVSFTCLLLAVAPLLRSSRGKALAAGLMVNFKVYLIAAIVPLLIKRRWHWVEQALLAVVVIYLLSYAVLGRGTLPEILRNIQEFSSNATTQVLDLWYASTYYPTISLLNADTFPSTLLLGSKLVAQLQLFLPLTIIAAQIAIVAASLMAALRPEVIPPYRIINHGLMLALITYESGGYTPVYFMLLVLMEPWRGFGRKYAILACYVLAIPLDIPIDHVAPVVRDTYIGGSSTVVEYAITVSPFVRPLVIISIAIALACVSIREVWQDIRQQGWVGRSRLHRDAALLPLVRRPRPADAAGPVPE